MSIRNWMKPSYIKSEFLKATKRGWVYTKNHDEVIIAVASLPKKLEDAGLNPDGTVPEVVVPVAPVNTLLPLVTGIMKAGNTLTTTNGTWESTGIISYSYLWEYSINNGTTWNSTESTTSTFLLQESHVGQVIRSKVTATNPVGATTVESAKTTSIVTAIVNPSNTVAPVLSGTAKAGMTLSTTDGTWTGTAPINYTYVWEESSNGTTFTTLTGQTSKTLILTETHTGKHFRVNITATNIGGSANINSNKIGPIITALVAPTITTVPTITGTAKAGNTLTTTDGVWSGSPTITYTNAWESSTNGTTWNAVAGQTGKTFVLAESHVGQQIRSKVTATNSIGNTSATSVGTATVVTAIVNPLNTVAPVLSGTAKAGMTLTTTDGTWTGTAPINYTYVWEESPNGTSSFTTIVGATTKTFALTESHTGKHIRVTVKGTNIGGNSTSLTNVIGPVITALIAPANTVAPVLSGELTVGSTLSVTNGTWTGSPTINYTYVWESTSDDSLYTPIGNTTANYVLLEGDIGKKFRVTVKGTNTVGNTTKLSNIIGPAVAA